MITIVKFYKCQSLTSTLIVILCMWIFWIPAPFAVAEPFNDVRMPPPAAEELWKKVVALLSSPDGRVDLDRLKATFHVDPIAAEEDAQGQNLDVYRAAVGPDKKLGYLFITPHNSLISVSFLPSIRFFWLDDPSALEGFRPGNVPGNMCIPPKEIEADFLATGWVAEFLYSNYKSYYKGILPASEGIYGFTATFRKGQMELSVELNRESNCFHTLGEALIPISRVEMDSKK